MLYKSLHKVIPTFSKAIEPETGITCKFLCQLLCGILSLFYIILISWIDTWLVELAKSSFYKINDYIKILSHFISGLFPQHCEINPYISFLQSYIL